MYQIFLYSVAVLCSVYKLKALKCYMRALWTLPLFALADIDVFCKIFGYERGVATALFFGAYVFLYCISLSAFAWKYNTKMLMATLPIVCCVALLIGLILTRYYRAYVALMSVCLLFLFVLHEILRPSSMDVSEHNRGAVALTYQVSTFLCLFFAWRFGEDAWWHMVPFVLTVIACGFLKVIPRIRSMALTFMLVMLAFLKQNWLCDLAVLLYWLFEYMLMPCMRERKVWHLEALGEQSYWAVLKMLTNNMRVYDRRAL